MKVKEYDNDESEKHIDNPKMGQSFIPDILDKKEQERLFKKLDDLKKKGIGKESKEYQEIRNELIVHNMKLARRIANSKYLTDLGIERKDLEQMAMELLINSVDSYDISRGTKFSTYAVPNIYNGIRKEWGRCTNNNATLKSEWKRLERFEEEMLKSLNRKPTDEEIKAYLGISHTELEGLKKYINYHLRESLDELNEIDIELMISYLEDDGRNEEIESALILDEKYIYEEECFTEKGTRNVEDAAQIALMKKDLENILNTLPEIEKRVLELRLGWNGSEPKTLREIGKEFNVTPQRISAIERKALKKLKHPWITKNFGEYRDAEFGQYEGIYDKVDSKNQILKLLAELKKLDAMLQQTAIETNREKELKAKRKKIEDLIQNKTNER